MLLCVDYDLVPTKDILLVRGTVIYCNFANDNRMGFRGQNYKVQQNYF